ncbi:MAG: hypothetical protein ABSA12_14665 [Verrucomicrobiia bacterium]
MNERLCEWPDCGRLAGRGWDVHGRSYCGPHYFPGLEKAFLEAYARWDAVREPSDEFKNLFSRYVERLYPAGGMPEKLSQNRIEARAVAWKKTQVGLEFSIERHLMAYRWGGVVKTVNQEWRFGLLTKDLVLLRQQDAVPPRKLGMIGTAAKSGAPASGAVNQ